MKEIEKSDCKTEWTRDFRFKSGHDRISLDLPHKEDHDKWSFISDGKNYVSKIILESYQLIYNNIGNKTKS